MPMRKEAGTFGSIKTYPESGFPLDEGNER